jgi:hypothetical protein
MVAGCPRRTPRPATPLRHVIVRCRGLRIANFRLTAFRPAEERNIQFNSNAIYLLLPAGKLGTETVTAQRIQILFTDDLDGSEAEEGVLFALDGPDYETGLNTQHAGELRDALACTGHARRVSGPGRRAGQAGRGPFSDGISSTQVRAWARSQDIEVRDRGRIPAGVIARYMAATGG